MYVICAVAIASYIIQVVSAAFCIMGLEDGHGSDAFILLN